MEGSITPGPANSNMEEEVLTAEMEQPTPRSPDQVCHLTGLQNNPSLWYKIHVFIYDLRNFREIPDSQKRLDRITDASYIGTPYFTTTEVSQLKSTIIDPKSQQTLEQLIEETLNERLERRMKKRVESGDYRVCAAHDLAPIFEKAFDIKPKDLARNVEFLAVMEKSGLKLNDDDEWKGSSKKSSPKKNKKKH